MSVKLKKKSSKKKSTPKLTPKKSIKKNPQDTTLRNSRSTSKKIDELHDDIRELKEVVGSSHNRYEKQLKVKEVLEKSGLDSSETIKVTAAINGIIWGS